MPQLADPPRMRLGVLNLGGERLRPFRVAEQFSLLDLPPEGAVPAGVDAVLLGWGNRAPDSVRAVRFGGYRGPLIAALPERSAEAAARALGYGCDDAQALPLHPRELAARIGAIRQRILPDGPRPVPKGGRIAAGRLEIGLDGADPRLDGKPLKVSPNCAKVLAIVAASRHPVPLPRIALALYGAEPPPSKTINTYLCMLRSIMATASGEDSWLKLHDGGYVLHRSEG